MSVIDGYNSHLGRRLVRALSVILFADLLACSASTADFTNKQEEPSQAPDASDDFSSSPCAPRITEICRERREHRTSEAGEQEANRQEVVRLMSLAFNEEPLDLVDKLLAPGFVQHDERVADGAAGLKAWLAKYRATNPESAISIKRIIADGNLVMVHANVVGQPGTLGDATADFYRIANHRIVEHWNVVQSVPKTTTSGNDMFSTLSPPSLPCPDPGTNTEATRTIADAMFGVNVVAEEDRVGLEPYYQHSTNLPNGLAPVAGLLTYYPKITIHTVQYLVEDDYIVFHNDYLFDPTYPHSNVMDMWRVRDGKIVEHWDVVATVATTPANANGPF